MSPDDFKLLGTLPGLYFVRDWIDEQITTIEARFKVPQVIKVTRSEQISQQQRNAWSNYTPEQKAERIRKVKLGIKRAKKLREAESQ